MELQRKQFTFYSSFAEAILRIRKPAERALAYDAIVQYALYGMEPDFDNLPDCVGIVFSIAKPNLDASRRKAAGGTNGKPSASGGKMSERYDKDSGKIAESSGSIFQQTSERCGKQEKEQEQDKDKEQMLLGSPPKVGQGKTAERFVPPTVDQVRTYCQERGNSVNPQTFVDFYASKGWKVGNQSMKDWKAAVRTWENTENTRGRGNKVQPQGQSQIITETGETLEQEAVRRMMERHRG